ncbi:hypothetical protein [Halorhabdus salina]|uniref:hypothetical protein n=1 Tax=Halorhabdus salina TaxID=2750670 RepID=UPI0015EEDF87|nr:hypothetical protein [Halorhabdus salina]
MTDDEMRAELQRQSEALEEIGDRLAVQNAALLELISTQQRANRIAMGEDPDDWPTPKSRAKSLEGNVLTIAEDLDLDAARRFADD